MTSSKPIRRLVKVTEYLKTQKRFAHLFGHKGRPDLLAAIQASADLNIKRYNLIDENTIIATEKEEGN